MAQSFSAKAKAKFSEIENKFPKICLDIYFYYEVSNFTLKRALSRKSWISCVVLVGTCRELPAACIKGITVKVTCSREQPSGMDNPR